MNTINFSIHHVALSVRDIESSISFYTKFGFELIRSYDAPDETFAIRHLRLSGTILELFSYRDSSPAPETSAELATDLPRRGVKHFGLVVPNINAARQFILENKFAESVEIRKGKTGVDYFFIKDPDGILMEILQDDLI